MSSFSFITIFESVNVWPSFFLCVICLVFIQPNEGSMYLRDFNCKFVSNKICIKNYNYALLDLTGTNQEVALQFSFMRI